MVIYLQYCRIFCIYSTHILVSELFRCPVFLHVVKVWASIRQPLNAERRLSHCELVRGYAFKINMYNVRIQRTAPTYSMCSRWSLILLHNSPNDGSGKQNFHYFPHIWTRILSVTCGCATTRGSVRKRPSCDTHVRRIDHLYNIHQVYSGCSYELNCRDIATPSFKYLT